MNASIAAMVLFEDGRRTIDFSDVSLGNLSGHVLADEENIVRERHYYWYDTITGMSPRIVRNG